MDRFTRDDLRAVFQEHGIGAVWRATPNPYAEPDDYDETFLIEPDRYQSADLDALYRSVCALLPTTKVGIIPLDPAWSVEPL